MTDTTFQDRADQVAADIASRFDADFLAIFEAERAQLRSAGAPARAVAVGDTLPAVTLLTSAGASVPLAQVIDGRPTVVVFYRGAWCPWCNLTLAHYQEHLLPALRAHGVGLVAISPQTPASGEQMAANGGLEFPVLSDPGNALAGDLGIVTAPTPEVHAAQRSIGLDVTEDNADGTTSMPFLTVLVVDGMGNVRFVDIHVDYRGHTEVSEILTALRIPTA